MSKKYIKDFEVVQNMRLDGRHVLLKLRPLDGIMPKMEPGQFAQVRVDGANNTFLRRPISINYVDEHKCLLWLLVQMIGDGTKALGAIREGEKLDLLLPLGRGFDLERALGNVLLVGGGVGIAPMLFAGKVLSERGVKPTFLLGARNADGIIERECFEAMGNLLTTTEDGSCGEKGFVIHHSALERECFNTILVCGPKPMMVAMAGYAHKRGICCEVSLENMMACGIGACLCCVEKTVRGNVCVCKEGPVFNINELTWQY